MGRIYTVPFTGTVTNSGGNADLWEFVPATQKPIRLRGFTLNQISEVGDTAEEGLQISIVHLAATVTSGSGGSSVTPVPRDPAISDLAAGFMAEVNNTTVATSSGTTTIIEYLGWNNRQSPYEKWYPDERFAPQCRNAGALVIRLDTTVADDMTFNGTAFVEEE